MHSSTESSRSSSESSFVEADSEDREDDKEKDDFVDINKTMEDDKLIDRVRDMLERSGAKQSKKAKVTKLLRKERKGNLREKLLRLVNQDPREDVGDLMKPTVKREKGYAEREGLSPGLPTRDYPVGESMHSGDKYYRYKDRYKERSSDEFSTKYDTFTRTKNAKYSSIGEDPYGAYDKYYHKDGGEAGPSLDWSESTQHRPRRKRDYPEFDAVVEGEGKGELGFVDLCRFFRRELAEEFDEFTANNVATTMIDCWKKNKYQYSELEEMYLINMQHNQDRELLARELGNTIGDNRDGFPKGVSCSKLVNLTIRFFNSEPAVRTKLTHIRAEMSRKLETGSVSSMEDSRKRKNSKYEGLRPITSCLETILERAGLTKTRSKIISTNITERLITASYGWDRILQYHSRGRDKFKKKLIPHIYMSKDDFPPGLDTDGVLNQLYDFINTWKLKLFEVLTTGELPSDVGKTNIGHAAEFSSHRKRQRVDTESSGKEERMIRYERELSPAAAGPSGTSQFNRGPEDVGLSSAKPSYRLTGSVSSKGYPKETGMKRPVYSDPMDDIVKTGYESGFSNDDVYQPLHKPIRKDYSSQNDSKSRYSRMNDSQAIDEWTNPDKELLNAYPLSPEKDESKFRYEITKVDRDYDARKPRERKQPRDIDARVEKIPKPYFGTRDVVEKDGYVSVEDCDGKTTFYHYADPAGSRDCSHSSRERKPSTPVKSAEKSQKSHHKISLSRENEDFEEDEKIYPKKEQNTKEKALKKKKKEKEKEKTKTVSGSLLEKVTEILKSCSELNPNISVKNYVEQKKEKKEHTLAAHLEKTNKSEVAGEKHVIEEDIEMQYEKSLEDGEIHGTDVEDTINDVDEALLDENLETPDKITKRKVTVIGKKNKEKEAEKDDDILSKIPKGYRVRSFTSSKSPSPSVKSTSRVRSKSKSKSRSRSSSRSQSRSRSPTRSRSKSDSGNKKRSVSRQSRSLSRSRSRSVSNHRYKSKPKARRSQSHSPSHYQRQPFKRYGRGGYYDNTRQRSRSRTPPKHPTWIPVSPCSLQENIELDALSTTLVRIATKEEFSFKENIGSMVRITKWTGRDSVPHIQISPQIVTIEEDCCMEIEVRNPYPDKKLFLQKHDKIACLSVLSGPLKYRDFKRDMSPDTMETSDQRWFKVSSVVLHRKGTLDRITIYPGRTMKIIATIVGPIKKYAGKEIMISKLHKDVPVEAQITRICENENVGFEVRNRGTQTLKIFKNGQEVALLSVWATVKLNKDFRKY